MKEWQKNFIRTMSRTTISTIFGQKLNWEKFSAWKSSEPPRTYVECQNCGMLIKVSILFCKAPKGLFYIYIRSL